MFEKDNRRNVDAAGIDLYSDLTPDRQREAEYRLLRYLAIVRRIFERICTESPELLTELERRAMLRKERQNSDHSAEKR